jgi:hypothetical protein
MTFAYIVNEPELKNTRRGILVIKTAVDRLASGKGDRVTLAREAYKPIFKCERYPAFSGDSVSTRSYDRYHDYSYRVPKADEKRLENFHVSYAARLRGCRRSNDATTDSYFAGRWQSNRSQFSFDTKVVARGQHSQFLAQFGSTPVYASTSMSQRRVEIKRYDADENGLACVLFSTAVKPGSFIRINDFERRRGLFRAAEQSWEWRR